MGAPSGGIAGAAEGGDGGDAPLGGPLPPHLALRSEVGKTLNLLYAFSVLHSLYFMS